MYGTVKDFKKIIGDDISANAFGMLTFCPVFLHTKYA